MGVASGPRYPLQLLVPLRFTVGFPLLSLTQTAIFSESEFTKFENFQNYISLYIQKSILLIH